MVEPFPLIEVSGPPRERGRQYGRQAGERIHRGARHYAAQLERAAFDPASIRALTREYVPRMEAFDSAHVEEMRGIAEGADIEFEAVALLNARTDDFATPWSVCRPPRPSLGDTMTATVAMVVMEPALGVMEVAPLPALNRRFTTYRLEMPRAAARAVAS